MKKNNFFNTTLCEEIFNAFPEMVMVLDKNKRIVYCNNSVLECSGNKELDEVVGLIPGQALKCIHASDVVFEEEQNDECGDCGMRELLLASEQNGQVCRECLLPQEGENAFGLNLRVWRKKVVVEGEEYNIVILQDIINEKRKDNLHRIFFHDVLNDGFVLSALLSELEPGKALTEDSIKKIQNVAKRMVGAIVEQKELTAAREGELKVHEEDVAVYDFLDDITRAYLNYSFSEGKKLSLDCSDVSAVIRTDPNILGRVLGNLIKNALEATPEGGTVSVKFNNQEGKNLFLVQNPSIIPNEIKGHMFQRFFTTKGKGRGIGTYSVKVLVERYLKGKVCFDSEEGKGTVFAVQI